MTTRRAATWIITSLTVLNLLNYIDRSVLAAVLAQMKQDPLFRGHSEASLGLWSSAFLITYMIVSPISGVLATRVPRKWLVAGGVLIWSLATVATGLAQSYHQVLIARAFIGFGEAGFATVAPAMISDLTAPSRRARVLAVFYLAIPVGYALGYVLGGNVGQAAGWRAAFFLAGAPGILFAVVQLLLPEPQRGASDGTGELPVRVPLGQALGALARNAPFILNVTGGAFMTFAMGAAAYWIPKYLQEIRAVSQASANTLFGAGVILTGIMGTAAGGFLGDRWIRRDPGAYYLLSGIGLCIAAPFFLLSPFMPTLAGMLGLALAAQLFLFLNTGPLNAAIMRASAPAIRETAMGVNILGIHLFGDAISPTVVGWLVDTQRAAGVSAAQAWSRALGFLAVPTLLGGFALLLGARAARREAARKLPQV